MGNEVTSQAGMKVGAAFGLGLVWGDYDNDGDQDLYVASDSVSNFLFQNQGDGRFVEVGLLSGVAVDGDGKNQAGMGVDFGDYDRDGLLDLYVTNFSDDYNTPYRNQGNGFFKDVTFSAGLGFPSWSFLGWGTGFADLDNDGWEDIFVANGHIYPQLYDYELGSQYHQRKLLFRNLGRGRFQDVTAEAGESVNKPWSSRGAAVADFDNDGDLDIAVNNLDDRPSLYRNDTTKNGANWLLFSLQGKTSNPSAIGARVTLGTGSTSSLREVRGGSSFQSTHDLRVHFGVGAAKMADSVIVRWPTGRTQSFQGVVSRRWYRLSEGGLLEWIKEPKKLGQTDFR